MSLSNRVRQTVARHLGVHPTQVSEARVINLPTVVHKRHKDPSIAKRLHNFMPVSYGTAGGNVACRKLRVEVSKVFHPVHGYETVGLYEERFYNHGTRLFETTHLLYTWRNGAFVQLRRFPTRYSRH
jgi:hypothetical protein